MILDFFLRNGVVSATATGLATLNNLSLIAWCCTYWNYNSVLCGRYTENISGGYHDSCFDDGSTLFSGAIGRSGGSRPDGFIYYGAYGTRLRATEAMMLHNDLIVS